jgi:peptidoglycan hydrolase-like protein with peptidoglycan-binding domain
VRRTISSILAGGLLAVTLGACGGGAGPGVRETARDGAGDQGATTTTAASSSTGASSSLAPATTAPTTTAPTTTAPSTTTTAPPPPPPPPDAASDGTLRPGESGPPVLQLQQHLTALGYWLGEPDGGYGDLTRQAVLAFQKAEGLDRDGIAGPATRGRLAGAGRPAGRSTSGDLIEVDLARQLLLVIDDGQVRWAFNTSSGAAATPTPTGNYTIQRQVDGYRHAPLGVLYRPKYFVGGVAIHGYPSVPAYPASHACTRVSNPAMDLLWSSGVAEIGTPVWVY